MRRIVFIVLHCSDSDVAAHDNPQTIEEWHLARGFTAIGYHFVITQDGVVHTARPEHITGAHCKGHNANSIGICLTGRHKFSGKQFASLKELCKGLCQKYGLEKTDILGHCDLSKSKTCPNFGHREIIAAWEWH